MKLWLVTMCVGVFSRPNGDDDFDLDTLLKDEFRDEPGAGQNGSSDESAKRDFKEFDVNNDGQIDAHEIRSIFEGSLGPSDIFDFMAPTDTDGSGTISLDEYLVYARKVRTNV
jgi:hypothetical protein